MIVTILKMMFVPNAEEAEHRLCRHQLRRAGLSEKALRKMAPDDRVAVLERARLDPYDFIYLNYSFS